MGVHLPEHGVDVGVGDGDGDNVAVGLGLEVAVGVAIGVSVGLGVNRGSWTSNEPMSIRPFTTRSKLGPR